MTIDQQKHRELLRIRFDVREDIKNRLSNDDLMLIERYGTWLKALAKGALTPATSEQRRFVSVAQHKSKPQSNYEQAWSHYCNAIAVVRAEYKQLATEKNKVETKAQLIRAMKSDTSAWSGNYKSGLGVLTDIHASKFVENNKMYSCTPPTEKWMPCHQCGGDGGAGGRCPSCGGNGFEP